MSFTTFIELTLANSHEVCCDRLLNTVEQFWTKPETMNKISFTLIKLRPYFHAQFVFYFQGKSLAVEVFPMRLSNIEAARSHIDTSTLRRAI